MKSVMKHQFHQAPSADVRRSSFDRSAAIKTTFQAGQLIPIFCDEALPGDTFNLSLTAFARLATPIFPIMDNMHMDTFWFGIPYRLLWDNFPKFMGEQRNPGESTDFLIPQMVSPDPGGYSNGSLHDHLGIPPLVPGLSHSVLWHRAYNLVYNQWLRDQNLQSSRGTPTDDGPDDESLYTIQHRGKRHDYFTSCLPWPQKTENPVTLPLGDKAPIIGLGLESSLSFPLGGTSVRETGGGVRIYESSQHTGVVGQFFIEGTADDQDPLIFADLSAATSATINELRQSVQIQKIFERDARGGTRLVEIIKSHFGVTSPDARMQRPELLGTGSSPINISPVAQTSNTGVTGTPQANLAAIGTAVLANHGFTKSFTEHTILLGLVSVRADLTYQQGLPRMFQRKTRFDHYWPDLSNIGEQAVLNSEIFAQGSDDQAADDAVFGYQERHAEYRYKQSEIHAGFRSSDPLSLDSWHLSQDFATLPVLGGAFIIENPPVDRVVAVTTEPHFLFDGYMNLRCARPMPMYGTPGMGNSL